MQKCLRDIAQPLPRVQSTRTLRDVIKAFHSKPDLNAIFVLDGTDVLGLFSRDLLQRLVLSQTDLSVPLSKLPRQAIIQLSPSVPIAKVALKIAKSTKTAEIVTTLQDGRQQHVSRQQLLKAVAIENAIRAKALLQLQKKSNQSSDNQTTNTNPMLTALTHEIRTPLSGMMGLAEVLTERLPDSEARNLAQMILEAGQDLDRALRNADQIVSEKGLFDAGEMVTTDLETLVDDLRESWALLAARQKTRFSINLAADGPPRIRCHEGQVRETIDNLINNALRFTRSGDIEIRLSTQPVDDQPLLSVSISQTGRRLSGAQKQTIDKALEEGTIGGDIPSWALGLVVSQQTARKLGGTLTHADNPLGGSVLTITLPVELAELKMLPTQPEVSLKSGRFDLGTVLLVEDHEASAITLIDALETAGWTVIHTHTLRDAAQIVDTNTLQAIITDLNLMDGNGLSLIERVRQIDGVNQAIPVISMTAEIGQQKARLALNAGASWTLRKPVQGPNLVALLADMIINTQQTDDAQEQFHKRLTA
ncbi:MAG: response regulator [Pseudomonadota bacterium]